MRGLLLAVTLFVSTQAEAHCHRIWHYNFPQHCSANNTYTYHYRWRHYTYSRNNASEKVEQKEPPKEEEIKPQPIKVIPEPCKHEGNYDPREYALCLARIELKIYEVTKKAGLSDYKEEVK